MYLSPSGFKTYKNCPYSYWHKYVNYTVPVEAEDRMGSIFGSAIGVIFEDFYKLKLWKEPNPREALLDRVKSTVDRVLLQAVTPRSNWKGYSAPPGVLLWKGEGPGKNPKGAYSSKEDIYEEVKGVIPNGLKIIKYHRLLGPRTDTELNLESSIKGHKLGARTDFVIQRITPHNDLVIIDGKGSKYRGSYTDDDQLLWYATLLRHKEKVTPDRIGFLFWRCRPEESVEWVDFNCARLDIFLSDVIALMDSVEKDIKAVSRVGAEQVKKLFKPNPSKDSCKFCPYADKHNCPEGLPKKTKKTKN